MYFSFVLEISILVFNAPKLHLDYEARRSGGLRINLYYLGTFSVRPNLITRLFLFFASIRRTVAASGIEPASRALVLY